MSATTLAELAHAHRQPISVAMYHQMIDSGVLTEHDRVELIEGVIVAVSPRSPPHVFAVRMLLHILNRALLPEEWSVRAGAPLTLARSEPEPDIAVVRTPLDDEAVRHPTTASLVIEVSKTSLSLDRALAPVYAEANVTESWVVDVKNQRVEVFRDREGMGLRDPRDRRRRRCPHAGRIAGGRGRRVVTLPARPLTGRLAGGLRRPGPRPRPSQAPASRPAIAKVQPSADRSGESALERP